MINHDDQGIWKGTKASTQSAYRSLFKHETVATSLLFVQVAPTTLTSFASFTGKGAK